MKPADAKIVDAALNKQPMPTPNRVISTGTEESLCYEVQFRSRGRAFQIKRLGLLADHEWRALPLTVLRSQNLIVGVPISERHAQNVDWGVPFQVAEAHRWILISLVNSEGILEGLELETRIVEHQVIRTHKIVDKGETFAVPHWLEQHEIRRKPEAFKTVAEPKA